MVAAKKVAPATRGRPKKIIAIPVKPAAKVVPPKKKIRAKGKPAPEIVMTTKRKTPYVRQPKIIKEPITPAEKVSAVKQGPTKHPAPPLTDYAGIEIPSFLRNPGLLEDSAPVNPKTGGRTSVFSEEIFTEICERIEDGEALTVVCRSEEKYPSAGGFLYWIEESHRLVKRNNEEDRGLFLFSLAERYARAVEARKRLWAEQYLEVASQTRKGKRVIKKQSQFEGSSTTVETFDAVERAKLHAGAIQWLLTKLDSKYAPPKHNVEIDNTKLIIEGGLGEEHIPEDTAEDIAAYNESMENEIIKDSTEINNTPLPLSDNN